MPSADVPSDSAPLYQRVWLKSTGFERSSPPIIALTIDMPAVTEVMARKRIIEITAIENETVFTLAESCRSVKTLSPRQ